MIRCLSHAKQETLNEQEIDRVDYNKLPIRVFSVSSELPISRDIKTGNIETAVNYQFIWLQFVENILEINSFAMFVMCTFPLIFGFKILRMTDS